MRKRRVYLAIAIASLLSSPTLMRGGEAKDGLKPEFHTSDRCMACHNRTDNVIGQGHLHWLRLALQHHGEFCAGSLLAG